MRKLLLHLTIFCTLFLSACSKKLTTLPDKSNENIATTYQVMKDVAYGSDAEQAMDIYLSEDAKSLGKLNYTIVFLHGGGYYLSDKSDEEKYIEPYLKKGLNVINMNYRLKKGIPLATSDLTNALNFLKKNNGDYNLNLNNIIVTGFSAGAHIATNVGVAQNNPEYPNKLNEGITITGIINFSGPVDGLDIVEKIFSDHENKFFRNIGRALFPLSEDYASPEEIAVYEPITYFDKNDPPIFLWHGGKDNQIPPETFAAFVPMLDRNKDVVIYAADGQHDPTEEEFKQAYMRIFTFLDDLKTHDQKKKNTIDMKQERLTRFGNDYTKAWNSQQPENVASFFAEKGTLIVNGGEPLSGRNEITEFARGFMTAFPDMRLTMDSLVTTPNGTAYHWSFVGTNTGPEGTGNKVLFNGFERWTFNEDGLIKISIGTFDEEEYSRQVKGE